MFHQRQIFRDPRWGRGQETPGEDPTLNADFASAFVSGFQAGDADPAHLKASACCKHFAAYNLENADGFTRNNFNAIVTAQDLADTYFPAFVSCANRGNASGMMCSYNAVNGVPSCASKELLTENLRDKWGFNGYVTSDCGAIDNVQNDHHYTSNDDDTCVDTMSAGCDSDCGKFYGGDGGPLSKAITDGNVTKAIWYPALANLIRVQMRLGMFDPDAGQPFRTFGAAMVDTAAHRQLALEAARQGVVLVKNDGGALPLSRSAVRTLAAVGPNAAATRTMQSNYFGTAPFLISPVDGLSNFTNVTHADGCTIAGNDTDGISAAVDAARATDATVLVVGLDAAQEHEAHDRTSISLPGSQDLLVRRVAAAARGPVILVAMCGGMVDLAEAKANPNVTAILIVGYPGQSGGQAIAETLFGDNNPGGKLTQTWYRSDFTEQCKADDMNMRPNATTGCPGRTYRFFTGEPVFKFGEGMSYTTFEATARAPAAAAAAAAAAPPLSAAALNADIEATRYRPHTAPVVRTVEVAVSNTGVRAGAETILGFVSPPGAGTGGEPLHSLRRFQKVHLAPGASSTVALGFTAHDFATHDVNGSARARAGTWTLRVGSSTTAVIVAE